jgi:hypothetical protein
MPLPEPAIELVRTYMRARRELQEKLADGGWHPVADLHTLISDELAHSRFRLSASWDHRLDADSQPDLVETFRRILGREVYEWLLRGGLLEVRNLEGGGEVRLADPKRAAQSLAYLHDLDLERWGEAVALGSRVTAFFSATT